MANNTAQQGSKLEPKLILVCVTAAIGGFLFGYDTSVINGGVDAIASSQSGFGLSAFMSGFSVSSALIGCIVGAWFAGTLADRFGRVRVMQFAAVLFVISAIGAGLSSSFVFFVIIRIVGGVGVGFTSAIGPAYISEVSPVERRGFLTGFQQLAIVLGITTSLIVNDIYALVSGGAANPFWFGMDTWRWMLITTAVPGIIMFIMAFTLPESPRYLVMKERYEEATKILGEVTGEANPKAKVLEIAKTLKADMGSRPHLSDLRGHALGLKPVVWVGIGIALFQQISGVNVVMFYDSSLWQMVGLTEQQSLNATLIRTAMSLIATIIGMLLIDRVGRRRLLRIGSAGMAIFLAIIALGFAVGNTGTNTALHLVGIWPWVVIGGSYIFFFIFSATWGIAMWVVIGEVFPNSIRALAVALATAANWVGNFLITTTFPPMRDSIGLPITYVIYAIMAVLSYVFVRKFLPETNGVELEDMKSTAITK
ncbi:MAG: sugar porter family MFS transporter [Bifidobacteriaceae bacterium]|jgi:sugar porter (SP) family MFS transporter|nr:sugar porter family MFS transporter [Bifidobacteriaceae bacterium]